VDVVLTWIGGDTRNGPGMCLKRGGIDVAAFDELTEEDKQTAKEKHVHGK
jgi:hypothetical protein